MTGDKFLRGMLAPIEPRNIFFLLQSGYPADFILGLTEESLNGLRNRSTTGGVAREADPDFFRALRLMNDVHAADALGMRVEADEAKGSTSVVYFRSTDISVDVAAKADEVRRLLKLAPDQQRFTLVYSPVRGTDRELAVNSRSMVQIMTAFASYMEAPAEHLQNKTATPAFENAADDLIKIHSGTEAPAAAFAAVHYRDYWYWVENNDLRTKRALTAVMFLFTLADTGGTENLPVVTIPAQ